MIPDTNSVLEEAQRIAGVLGLYIGEVQHALSTGSGIIEEAGDALEVVAVIPPGQVYAITHAHMESYFIDEGGSPAYETRIEGACSSDIEVSVTHNGVQQPGLSSTLRVIGNVLFIFGAGTLRFTFRANTGSQGVDVRIDGFLIPSDAEPQRLSHLETTLLASS